MEHNQEKLLRGFKKVINERSLDSMNKALYEFFHLYCGFIAHYNIHGFKAEYEGVQFALFLNNFVKLESYITDHDVYGNCIQAMCDYANEHEAEILFEIKNRLENERIKKIRQLAEELGYDIVKKGSGESTEVLSIQSNGQLAIF